MVSSKGLLILAGLVLAASCGEPPVRTPDVVPPEIMIVSPRDGVVISGPVAVRAEATDDEGLAEVRIYVGEGLAGRYTDPPFEYWLSPVSTRPGECKVFAEACDAWDNEAVSDTLTVYFNWRYAIADDDDWHWDGDILEAFARTSQDSLQVQIYIDRQPYWEGPGAMNFREAMFFLNTDGNRVSGNQVCSMGADIKVAAYIERGELPFSGCRISLACGRDWWCDIGQAGTVWANDKLTVLRLTVPLGIPIPAVGMGVTLEVGDTLDFAVGAFVHPKKGCGPEEEECIGPMTVVLDGLYLPD
jgi:hypothetical protein